MTLQEYIEKIKKTRKLIDQAVKKADLEKEEILKEKISNFIEDYPIFLPIAEVYLKDTLDLN